MISTKEVVATEAAHYPTSPPYSPSEAYPEYRFGDIGSGENLVYSGLRRLLIDSGYDAMNFDKPEWNPLGPFIKPGHTVLIKPNWVKHVYSEDIDISCFITHSSLLRAVADYAIVALKDRGRIIIGDAPIQSADFEMLKAQTGISEIVDYLRSKTQVAIDILDFRFEVARVEQGMISHRDQTNVRHVPVNVSLESEHGMDRNYDKYRVTHYDPRKMNRHHNRGVHEYLIAEPALMADVIINVPKLKTHRKAGITCCLKNQVGINASKDWLPHHSIGSLTKGGDEYRYPSIIKSLLRSTLDHRERSETMGGKRFWNRLVWLLKKLRRLRMLEPDPFFEGNWYGNDTLWRTILDLNKIIFYADRQGLLCDRIQRKLLYFVDAVVIGEREGPLHPSRKDCGLLLWGEDPAHTDACAASFIGFNPAKIRSVDRAFDIARFPITNNGRTDVVCRRGDRLLRPYVDGPSMIKTEARPSMGWRGHIEWNAVIDSVAALPNDENDY